MGLVTAFTIANVSFGIPSRYLLLKTTRKFNCPHNKNLLEGKKGSIIGLGKS